MQDHKVTSTFGKGPMNFKGELLAEVTTERPNVARYMIVRLYRTAKGKFVYEQITIGTDPHDFHNYKVFSNQDALLRRIDRTGLVNSLLLKAFGEGYE